MIVFRERFGKVVGQEKASNSFNALEGKDLKVNEIIILFEESTLLNKEVLMAMVFKLSENSCILNAEFLEEYVKGVPDIDINYAKCEVQKILVPDKNFRHSQFQPKGNFPKIPKISSTNKQAYNVSPGSKLHIPLQTAPIKEILDWFLSDNFNTFGSATEEMFKRLSIHIPKIKTLNIPDYMDKETKSQICIKYHKYLENILYLNYMPDKK